MKVRKGLEITRESWRVLWHDRKLLIFPILSTLSALALIGMLFSAGYLIPELGQRVMSFADPDQQHSPLEQAVGILCLFVLYFVGWFIAIFFNTALVGCALTRFSGGTPTVKGGLQLAVKRLPQILGWSLLTAGVGTLLSAVEQKLGWVGIIMIRLIGLTWTVATYFVVPLLAAEGVGPVTAVRQSVQLLKKTWGEGLTGNIAIPLISSGFAILALVFATAGFLAAVFLESLAIAIATGVCLVVSVFLVMVISSAMRQVFLAGLYRYAMTGEVPQGFSEASMKQALSAGKQPA
ncbi:DUF6159 family protein [Planctomicrobium piriforme]|uniref:Membrane domain of glycerophosphoryl diester phosphodiesterase n=1 Tax=Planctomicrobium piriforme TaxID=1576369 RepID=A0A1I3EK66_9PLAN|nr:DUF6159 family protein [Planctomicrobium piriforme]SFH99367.1 hypothetical protein SAMN05421753_104260 [Planctomicrobium piriforme]